MALTSNNAYWQIICELYANKEIQNLCLNWQEKYKVNINWLLLAAILQQQKQCYSHAILAQTTQQLEIFSQQHTQLIRQCRYNWQQSKNKQNYQTLKEALLQTELLFEQQEQAFILDKLSTSAKQTENDKFKNAPLDWLVNYYKLPQQQVDGLMAKIHRLDF